MNIKLAPRVSVPGFSDFTPFTSFSINFNQIINLNWIIHKLEFFNTHDFFSTLCFKVITNLGSIHVRMVSVTYVILIHLICSHSTSALI